VPETKIVVIKYHQIGLFVPGTSSFTFIPNIPVTKDIETNIVAINERDVQPDTLEYTQWEWMRGTYFKLSAAAFAL
jgi:hypothetical protein